MQLEQQNPTIKVSTDELNEIFTKRLNELYPSVTVQEINFFHCTEYGTFTHLGLELIGHDDPLDQLS